MFNATNRIIFAAAMTAASLLFISCGGGSGSDNDLQIRKLRKVAELDSIYNDCSQKIVMADSVIEASRSMIDRLRPELKHIELPQIEGYYVIAKGYRQDFTNSTGVSARVSDNGDFYIVTSVNPAGGLKHVSLTAMASGESVTTPTVGNDGDINFRYGDSEMITFSPEQSDSLGRFIALHSADAVTLRFNGAGGKSRNIKLSPDQVTNIAKTYEYASAVNNMRSMTIEREHLEKRRELALRQKEKYSLEAQTN